MIGAYLTDPVAIVKAGVPDTFNERPDPVVTPTMGYIEWKSKLIRNVKGEEVVSSGSVLMRFDATLSHADKIRIGDVDYSILRIQVLKDFQNVGMMVFLQ